MRGVVVTLLAEEKTEFPDQREGLVLSAVCKHLMCKVAGKGWALVTLMQLEKDGILLNLRKVLSSDHQDQHCASAGERVRNIYGVSTSFLRAWAVCSGTTLEAQNPALQ